MADQHASWAFILLAPPTFKHCFMHPRGQGCSALAACIPTCLCEQLWVSSSIPNAPCRILALCGARLLGLGAAALGHSAEATALGLVRRAAPKSRRQSSAAQMQVQYRSIACGLQCSASKCQAWCRARRKDQGKHAALVCHTLGAGNMCYSAVVSMVLLWRQHQRVAMHTLHPVEQLPQRCAGWSMAEPTASR